MFGLLVRGVGIVAGTVIITATAVFTGNYINTHQKEIEQRLNNLSDRVSALFCGGKKDAA